MYESVCVPDLGDFLGYQGAAHQVATTPEHESPATPASSSISNSSGPQNTGNQPAAPLQPPSAPVSLPSRQYHDDGKSLFSLFIYPLLQFPRRTDESRIVVGTAPPICSPIESAESRSSSASTSMYGNESDRCKYRWINVKRRGPKTQVLLRPAE